MVHKKTDYENACLDYKEFVENILKQYRQDIKFGKLMMVSALNTLEIAIKNRKKEENDLVSDHLLGFNSGLNASLNLINEYKNILLDDGNTDGQP